MPVMGTGTIGVELFRFNEWANEALIEFCRGLDEPTLQADAPGTRGSIQDTLVHIVAAQERYVGGLGRPRTGGRVHESLGWPGFEELLESNRETGASLVAAAAEEDPERAFTLQYQGRDEIVLARTFLVQAMHHANDHRTHICSILGAIGVEPPEVTGWGWAEAVAAK